ncbi:hypothetical protein ACJX0J_026419, partial [Zea mays]
MAMQRRRQGGMPIKPTCFKMIAVMKVRKYTKKGRNKERKKEVEKRRRLEEEEEEEEKEKYKIEFRQKVTRFEYHLLPSPSVIFILYLLYKIHLNITLSL